MKNILTFIILAVVLAGCSSQQETQDDIQVPQEPQQATSPPKTPPPSKTVYDPEPEHPGVKETEQERYEESLEDSKNARQSYVPERDDRTGRERTMYYVDAKFFDDEDVLTGIYDAIIDAAQKNYIIDDYGTKNRQGFNVTILSEMGPASLEKTLGNALYNAGYQVTIRRKKPELLVITPD